MIDLDLRVRRGSFCLEFAGTIAAPWTVIFGPSGAGKSTLLRMIAGLDQPDSGRIAIHDQYVFDSKMSLNLRPGKRSAGLVAQRSALFPHLTVAKNVAYGLSHLNPTDRQHRVSQMLSLLNAGPLAERSPRALSGGEAQRVSLARALAPMPRLLLLDEPLSALDAAARDLILTRLQSWLAEQKIQTILVTHDAADALATEAEVALLQEGKLTAIGPAGAVLAAERIRLLARLRPSG